MTRNLAKPLFFYLQQLFGFVYACYVSKVFQDDEDSCECFFCQESLYILFYHSV